MEILNANNAYDLRKMINLCKNLWEKQSLVPIVGAGFSCDTPTDNGGHVQSARELRNTLLQYIEQYSQYDADEISNIKNQQLAELASSFWDIFDRIPSDKIGEFYSDISCNFKIFLSLKNTNRHFYLFAGRVYLR